VSKLPPEGDTAPMPWPNGVPAPYGYLVARTGPPAPRGLVADVVLDGAGLYLAAATAQLAVRVRLARAVVPGLPVVSTGVTLAHGPIDGALWEALVARARAAMPDEVLLAVVAREPGEGEAFVAAAGPYTLVEPRLEEAGTGGWRPQRAARGEVRATPIPDAVVEVHSHHALAAYFSATDDRDETARRVYGVLGRLDHPTPELAFRVATGCKPHAVEPVPFDQVFAAEPGAFRDVHFDASPPPEPPTDRGSWTSGGSASRRRRLLTRLLLADMADDLAAIRELLEERPAAPPAAASLRTPR
jgi:Prokaryotic homologs of the JAB domain